MPTEEEIEERRNDDYRRQINRSDIRCHGVSYILDPKTVLRDPHRTSGLNFANNPAYRYGEPYIVLVCDECQLARTESIPQHIKEHPNESYGDPHRGVRSFYYKGNYMGEHHLGVYTLTNETKFRYSHPSSFQEIRPTKKPKDPYGRPVPRRKPTPFLSFNTTEEFYAYLESILEP